jgi:hypothetical protein
MTPECYETYRGRALRSARGDPREPSQQLFRDLYGQPGFAGIRSQVGLIVGLFRREFRRRHPRSVTAPSLPRLGYVQRLATTGIWLSDLLRPAIGGPAISRDETARVAIEGARLTWRATSSPA